MYETIDTMLSFEKPSEDIELNFSLSRMTNIARVQIEIPGEEESAVVINGIRESPSPIIDRNFWIWHLFNKNNKFKLYGLLWSFYG